MATRSRDSAPKSNGRGPLRVWGTDQEVLGTGQGVGVAQEATRSSHTLPTANNTPTARNDLPEASKSIHKIQEMLKTVPVRTMQMTANVANEVLESTTPPAAPGIPPGRLMRFRYKHYLLQKEITQAEKEASQAQTGLPLPPLSSLDKAMAAVRGAIKVFTLEELQAAFQEHRRLVPDTRESRERSNLRDVQLFVKAGATTAEAVESMAGTVTTATEALSLSEEKEEAAVAGVADVVPAASPGAVDDAIHNVVVNNADIENETKEVSDTKGEEPTPLLEDGNYADGDVIGAAAPELGAENKGRAMLEKMGWSKGKTLGVGQNQGKHLEPIELKMKRGRGGLR